MIKSEACDFGARNTFFSTHNSMNIDEIMLNVSTTIAGGQQFIGSVAQFDRAYVCSLCAVPLNETVLWDMFQLNTTKFRTNYFHFTMNRNLVQFIFLR